MKGNNLQPREADKTGVITDWLVQAGWADLFDVLLRAEQCCTQYSVPDGETPAGNMMGALSGVKLLQLHFPRGAPTLSSPLTQGEAPDNINLVQAAFWFRFAEFASF